MNWINSEYWYSLEQKRPEHDQKCFIVTIHWKEEFPLSYQCFGAEYQHNEDPELCHFFNNDYLGYGSQRWMIEEDLSQGCTTFWIPEEIAKNFLPHLSKEDEPA